MNSICIFAHERSVCMARLDFSGFYNNTFAICSITSLKFGG